MHKFNIDKIIQGLIFVFFNILIGTKFKNSSNKYQPIMN